MTKRVVVFGATGQLGAYSAKYLLDCGYDVIAVGRRKDDHNYWKSVGADYGELQVS